MPDRARVDRSGPARLSALQPGVSRLPDLGVSRVPEPGVPDPGLSDRGRLGRSGVWAVPDPNIGGKSGAWAGP